MYRRSGGSASPSCLRMGIVLTLHSWSSPPPSPPRTLVSMQSTSFELFPSGDTGRERSRAPQINRGSARGRRRTAEEGVRIICFREESHQG